MKYVYALFCLLLLAACAPQYAPQPAPLQYPPPQYVPPPQPQGYAPPSYPQPMPQAVPPVQVTPSGQAGLGSTQFTTHPYTVGNREATSMRPGTPIVGKLVLKKDLTNSPPITEDVTVFITVVYPDGSYELFGTADVPKILPSNVLQFDHSPDVQAWTNDKFVARAEINTNIDYIVFIKYHKDARYLLHTINVR